MPTDKKINYLELPMTDFDAAEAFYSKAFGWTFVDYGPDYRSFSDGTMDGGFFRSELKSQTAGGAALIVIFAEDLEAVRDGVVAAGGTIHKAIFSFPGGRRFHFQDTHGNELAVWSDKEPKG